MFLKAICETGVRQNSTSVLFMRKDNKKSYKTVVFPPFSLHKNSLFVQNSFVTKTQRSNFLYESDRNC